jgi:hypothetical protein
MENTQEWLNSDPPIIEEKDGALFVPGWAVEADLNLLCEYNWNRHNHKYSFHVDHNGDEWVATSVLLELHYFISGITVKRILAGSSFIKIADYPESKNILQTGITEATKAGTKVLGNRFGYSLNNRTVIKEKQKKERVKSAPDPQIMKAYLKAVHEKDEATIKRLTTIYDIKTE